MRLRVAALVVAVAACDDFNFQESPFPTSPGGSNPPGSTASLGSTSAIIDNVPLTAPLSTPAIWRNDSFGFTGINAEGRTKILAVSLRLPGAGTYVTGGTYSPVVSYIEMDGQTSYRWFANFRQGSGSVTVSFLSDMNASGYFHAELVPDSATIALGVTGSKFVSNGTFSVAVMR